MATYNKTLLEGVSFDPDKIPPGLPLIFDDWTLAFHLGLRGRTLWYAVLNRDSLYKTFLIPKATGGVRVIHDPAKMMRIIARQLRVRILTPLCAKLGPHVGAYQLGKSTRATAEHHIASCEVCDAHDVHTCETRLVGDSAWTEDGNRATYRIERVTSGGPCKGCQPPPRHENCPRHGVKVHMDLKDFFGSTRRSWIRNYFHEVIGYNHYASGLLAQLMTVTLKKRTKKGEYQWQGVPQGAPFSGDITNLVADWRLDQKLLPKLKRLGWTYTRYADDLYFSHPQNLPRPDVDAMIKMVGEVVTESGYRLNQKKLRVQRPGRQQRVLGMTVNKKVNIPIRHFRRLRSLLHNCITYGFESQYERAKKPNAAALHSWVGGQLAYYEMIAPQRVAPLRLMYNHAKTLHLPPLVPDDKGTVVSTPQIVAAWNSTKEIP